MSIAGRFRRKAMGISPREATFAYRGFETTDTNKQRHLQQIGGTFIQGYNQALEQPRADPLAYRLAEVPKRRVGFAFEGAAMALALLDRLTPWNQGRFDAFLSGPAQAHIYMVHVGAGWAGARIPWVRNNWTTYLARFDTLLRWLVIDGYGFHQGYFHPAQHIRDQYVPTGLAGYQRRAFDQGLGRSLWFVCGASVARLVPMVQSFSGTRQPDLWSGVGLAIAYAGGASPADIRELYHAAELHRPSLCQGVAFAAKARRRAGNLTDSTRRACGTICAMTVDRAAKITDATLRDLPPDGAVPAYELWRIRIQRYFTVPNNEDQPRMGPARAPAVVANG